ncbi:MAG TPA: choice-of-anchor D domain-containing protein [Solirubrobacteraceae bacterium]|jgi:alpha-tubulin suppressor-like RCC1 family protein
MLTASLAVLLSAAVIAPRAGAVPAGQLYVSGSNGEGQLGDGTTKGRNTPELLQSLGTVTSAAGGYYQTLAVRPDGTVAAWGYNGYGELGDGTKLQHEAPELIPGLSGVTSVAAGDEFSLALRSDGTVETWGYGGYGELGNGKPGESLSPVVVSGLSNVVEIAAGYSFALALRSDGQVEAWGYNGYAELGDGTTEQKDSPVIVPGLSNVVAIAASGYGGYALLANGTVKAWGYGGYGELGLGSGSLGEETSPVLVPGLSEVRALAAGGYFMLALLGNGTVEGTGYNDYYELGDGTKEQKDSPEVVLSNAAAIGAAAYNSYALLTNGTVEGWGYNDDGELGDGSYEERHSPEVLNGLTGVFAFGRGNYNYDMLALEGAFAGLSSSSLAFPDETIGAKSAAQSLVLTNNGPAPLAISGDVLTGSGAGAFNKASDTCQGATLNAGQTCTIAYLFAPTAPGPENATVAISSSAANTLQTVSLSGAGVAGLAPPPPPVAHAPALSALSLAPGTFRAAPSGPSALSAAAATGTVISYADSLAATTTFTVQRPLRGVVTGSGKSKSCGKAPRHLKKGAKHCTYYKALGSFTHSDSAGANRLRFTGRLAGRALKPGAYRLVATAHGAGGTSSAETAGFKIVKH